MSEKDNVIDFNDYKRKKDGLDRPAFSEPTTITLGQGNLKAKYTVIANFVRNDRQFLALKPVNEEDQHFTLVEGIMNNGSLVKIVPIDEEEYDEVKSIFSKVFAKVNKTSDTGIQRRSHSGFKR